jgi:transcriptional regulator GlxA family with amidase domain
MAGEQTQAYVLEDPHCERSIRDPFEYYDRLCRLQDYVLANLDKHISRQTAARIACVTPGYFSTYFRSRVGIPFTAWLSGLRVKKAAELFTQTDLPVPVVADMVGFGTARTLERHFKKYQGLTPRAFKRDHMHDILSHSAPNLARTSNICVSQRHVLST